MVQGQKAVTAGAAVAPMVWSDLGADADGGRCRCSGGCYKGVLRGVRRLSLTRRRPKALGAASTGRRSASAAVVRTPAMDVSVTHSKEHGTVVAISLAPQRALALCAPPVPELMPGIQRRIPEAALGGWTCHLDVPFTHVTTTDDLRVPSHATRVFLLVRDREGALCLGAMGDVGAVLGATEVNRPRLHNGVWWHFTPGQSIGFSPNGVIDQRPADVLDRGCPLRVSWHLTGRTGGYRAGRWMPLMTPAQTKGDWRKLVYYQ